MEPFQVRLNCVDHYQAVPSDFDPPLPYRDPASGKYDKSKVPIIRVFGATETGQKVCVHVHGAYPYLYVEYEGDLEEEKVSAATRHLQLAIDRALAVSYNRNANDNKLAFVAHITLVKGVPFYGYHVGYKFYFKIYLTNPIYMTRLADLLLQGLVLKRSVQPYESHLQYIPQWMCDYSLYGCAYLICRNVKFRMPVPDYLELTNLSHRWHDRSIRPEDLSDPSELPKQSHCPLEADICVQDIMNRSDISERSIHHDFTEYLKPMASDQRLVPSMAGLWQDEERRRKKRLGLQPGSSPFVAEELVSLSVDPRNTSQAGWIHEDEYREMAMHTINEEKSHYDGGDVSLDNFLTENPLAKNVKTALQSVEDFYPGKEELTRLDFRNDNDLQPPEEAGASIDEEVAPPADLNEQPYISEDDNSSSVLFDTEPESRVFDPYEDGDAQEDFLDAGSIDLYEHTELEHVHAMEPAEGPSHSGARSIKRSLDQTPNHERSYKRQRFFEDALSQQLESPTKQALRRQAAQPKTDSSDVEDMLDELYEFVDHLPSQEASSQSTVRPAKTQNRRISFPVVKDPNDPMTVLRFSQDGSLSSKEPRASDEVNAIELNAKASTETSFNGFSSQLQSSQIQSPATETRSDYANTLDSGMAESIYDNFNISRNSRIGLWRRACPSSSEVSSALTHFGYPPVIYQKAHYSNESDVPDRPRDYAGREFRLGGTGIHHLPDFDPLGRSTAMLGEDQAVPKDKRAQEKSDRLLRETCTLREWEFAPMPPSRSEVIEWFEQTQAEAKKDSGKPQALPVQPNVMSQIEGPTQKNVYGFKYSQKSKSTSVEHQTQYMSMMSLEVHVNTRGALAPNPEEDEISCVFWCLNSVDEDVDANGTLPGVHVGMISQGEEDRPDTKLSKALRVEWDHEISELDLINRVVDIVRYHDPDIITGYEVHNSSWGYIIERARKKYEFEICDELSRVISQAHGRFGKDADKWGFNHTSSIRVTGRHMINIWRAMRSELNLLQYTMENVAFHLLHRRIPHYSFSDLTAWYQSGKPRDLMKVIDYFLSRVQMDLEILDSNELIARTSEQARLLGIDFYSVFSRGSQFKVESLMFRIAKAENFMLVSPSRKQVGQQNALECLPLVMEPQSDFYTSPLIVLDFQSLYPSIMIAYNYCYSTFLGRARQWRGRNKMGFMDYERQPQLLELLKDKINIAPNGMIYAKPEVRKSLLARMLAEILETRVMVKTGMKADKDDKPLQRLLNNRQLALKLIANVTYGYTSASFSGRMPCSEIADSIVQSGRETLEKAIAFIHSIERWGAEVVYGDTDSLFVYLKGRTRDQAFTIGEEIAQAVTKINPHPVKLKFEKVYHPCVLLAKKRYVGFKYEHREQTEPDFDAKGIETVRRDGTPAEQKIEEKALKLLFRTADLSQVKAYFQAQCTKIMQGRVSVQDFCFAREVKLGTYSDRGLPPPGALLSARRMAADPRAEPQYGERVPYVVVAGAPGSRLIDRCVAPDTLLHDATLDLDADYYITKNLIPPLERIFNLVGANVRQWYDEMPKVQRMRRLVEGHHHKPGNTTNTTTITNRTGLRKTLESYLKSSVCMVCKSRLDDHPEAAASGASSAPLCAECLRHPHLPLFDLVSRQRQAEKKVAELERICRSCMGVAFGEEVRCDSKDCPVFYSRTRAVASWRHTKAALDPVIRLLQDTTISGESALDW
ncbi:DNA-directed DNA polymerase zeta catalytic subunit REV3 [Aspergillus homomorphus CBS 101889]|uniref:DNA polymerase n=1 Tax=Aspergillus homomorphus (strain CBS 101889) TaxID=1450537 RepID=A0A395HS56_ASPHC|nr:DNA polymerase zeta catalytic subunit [Aspergillus homomorphus CBS 101889]RAL10610.1 DNA polymerase zeta catalytic subunit [Aspergillus homomorphus CBS 101889]